ncbi:hypothetical protein DFJ73DRAFT_788371 [Zopfochytrium polystomum]|nr:hypothetical protein DFJ73DRAFT_788371 [Zopfochytrium polystomum]
MFVPVGAASVVPPLRYLLARRNDRGTGLFHRPDRGGQLFALVTAVVNRTNNAVSLPRRYCEDPAILAWETGNELQTLAGGRVPANWMLAVARTVKDVLRTVPVDRIGAAGVAPGNQQLVLDGSDGARTAFPVGEFGLTATSNVRDLLVAVTTANASCVGAMLWSLRFRARDGGCYVHKEGGGYEAYHDRGAAGMGAGTGHAAGFGADDGAVMALMVVPALPLVVLRTGNATTAANGTADVSEAVAAGGTAAAAEAMFVDEVGAGVKAAWYRVTGWSPAEFGEMSEAVRLF